jgi:hypothetical protein
MTDAAGEPPDPWVLQYEYPQTLVWRSNAGRRRPLLDSLEKISRLTYFDMVNESQVLRECDEETALRACLEAIGPAVSEVPPA